MRYELPSVMQAKLSWRPGEFAEIPGRHFVSDVSQDAVVQLDDGHRALGGKPCGDPLLPVSVNSGAELTTQTGLYELH